MPTNEKTFQTGRRRVPRRNFEAPIGMLLHGKFNQERAFQVGEGGMMFSCRAAELKEGEQLVVSFFLPNGILIIVRGIVRSTIPPKGNDRPRYGIEFLNLEFQMKREIRNFVAAATRLDGHIQL